MNSHGNYGWEPCHWRRTAAWAMQAWTCADGLSAVRWLVAQRRKRSRSHLRTLHWLCTHSYPAVGEICISLLFSIDVDTACLTFPAADVLQTARAPGAPLVLWNYRPNGPYKPTTSCGFLCIWLLLVTNVIFYFFISPGCPCVWLSRIFQLSHPCWISCHYTT